MDRQLIILRHGAAYRMPGVEDFDRTLTQQGAGDSRRIGDWLNGRGLVPDRIVSSPAGRAFATASIVADGMGIAEASIATDERIYLASLERLLDVIRHTPAACRRLMIVSHNPGLAQLLIALVGKADLARHGGSGFAPASAAVVALDGSWRDVAAGAGRLEAFVHPSAAA